MPGLYEDFGAGQCRPKAATNAVCGGSGHRPCNIWERIPSCNSGLAENFLAHKCVASGGNALESNAQAVLRDTAALLTVLGGYVTCFDAKLLEHAVRRADPKFAGKMAKSSCIERIKAVAVSQGYRTLTIGISGGGSFILGSFVDTGFAFDLEGKRVPTLYQTKAISIGFRLAVALASTSVSIKEPTPSTPRAATPRASVSRSAQEQGPEPPSGTTTTAGSTASRFPYRRRIGKGRSLQPH